MSSTKLPIPDHLRSVIDWQQLTELNPDVILLVDRDGKVLYVNNLEVETAIDKVLGTTIFDQALPEFHRMLRQHLDLIFIEGCEAQAEFVHVRTDGKLGWWSAHAAPVFENGKVVAAIVNCHDIGDLQALQEKQERAVRRLQERIFRERSELDKARNMLAEEIHERRRAEESLRDSERRYRTLVSMARNAIASFDYDGLVHFLNPVAAAMLGGVPENFMGRKMQELFPPEIAARQLASIRRVIDNRQAEAIEAQSYVAGVPKWFLTQIQPVIEDDGSCNRVLIEATDIDERVKLTQKMLRERNFSESILQTANFLIICLDENANIRTFNRESERVTGYAAAEVIGRNWPQTFLPADQHHPGLRDFGRWVREHPHDSYEGPLLTKNGSTRTVLWSNSSFTDEETGETVAIAIGVDVTERHRLQQQLRATEYRHRALLMAIPDYILLINREGRILEVQGGRPEYLAHIESLILNKTVREAVPAEVGDMQMKALAHVLATGETTTLEYGLETDLLGWVDFEARLAKCGPDECVLVARDVTQRKIFERALRTSEEEHRFLVDQLQAGVVVHAPDGRVLRVNEAAARLLGRTVEQMLHQSSLTDWQFLNEDGGPAVPEQYIVNRVIATGKARENVVMGAKIPGSNEIRWALVNGTPDFDESGNLRSVIVCFLDITDRRQFEHDLAQATELLKAQQRDLEASNITLKRLIHSAEEEVDGIRLEINRTVETSIVPTLNRLRERVTPKDLIYIEILESMIRDLGMPVKKKLSEIMISLTPREREICAMIRVGNQSKEIADTLKVSRRTVEKFRQKIRDKLGVKGGKINLVSYLNSLEE